MPLPEVPGAIEGPFVLWQPSARVIRYPRGAMRRLRAPRRWATAPEPGARLTPLRRRGAAPALALLGEVVLTVAAVLGLTMTSLTVMATRTGVRPLVVRSGSMEPTIPTGSMVLVRRVPAGEIGVGDVVAVERPDHTRVIHRVVEVERAGASVALTLKGDANEDPDPAPVTVTEAHRLVRQLPAVGRVAAWLATAPGGFAVGCLVTAAIMRVVRRRRYGYG